MELQLVPLSCFSEDLSYFQAIKSCHYNQPLFLHSNYYRDALPLVKCVWLFVNILVKFLPF